MKKWIALGLIVVLALVGVLGHVAARGGPTTYPAVSVAIGQQVYCWPSASTSVQQERGLQGVRDPALPMVFTFSPARVVSFWMKATPAPLTGVWIGETGRVIGSWHGAPGSRVAHASPGVVATVLELPRGWPVPSVGSLVRVLGSCSAVTAL